MSINFIENSSNLSYLIGLLATDGYIHPTGPGVYISLSKYDNSSIKLLDTIQHIFGGSCHEYTTDYRWGIYEKQFKDFLVDIGFTHNKSKTLDVSNWFKQLNESQQTAFLTGAIDGDGCIRFWKLNQKQQAYLSIVSGSGPFHKMLLTTINHPKVKIKEYITKHGTKMYYINSYCGNIPKVFPNLYQTEIYLERKKMLYTDIINHYK